MADQFHIVEYDDIAEKLAEVKEAANFLPDVTSDEGYKKSKRVALDVGKLLTALEKKRKEKKEHFLTGGRQVDDQAKAIAKKLEKLQLPHKEAYKKLDNLKKEREANRKAELESRVEVIRNIVELMADAHSSEVLAAMNQMQAEECGDFYEYTEQALKARNEARKSLADLFAKKQKEENDAEELAKLKKEAEERAVKDREELIRREAAEEAEADTKAAIEREEAAKRDVVKAEFDRVAAERRALEVEKAADERAADAAEAARVNEVTRQLLEKQAEREEQERRESDKQHKAKINNAAAKGLVGSCGISLDVAKAVVRAIAKKEIPELTISY